MRILLSLVIILFIFGCEGSSSSINDSCDNKCETVGVNQCSDTTLMICKKDDKGCFVLEEVKNCENGCENNTCIENTNCDPNCNDWETCNNTVCELTTGKCNESSDCLDDKICDNHECVIKQIEKKKTKITLGAGTTTKSASFKMKVNVGKVKSIKKLNSASYKMKIGNSTK